MKTYYIRISAQNLSSSIFDTNDLSTIRGGSFLLLSLINSAKNHLPPNYKEVFSGASEALFEVESDNIKQLEDDIKNCLKGEFQYAVSCCEKTGDLEKDIIKLETQNRISQYQTLSFTPPIFEEKATTYCDYDKKRPAIEKKDGKNISAFTLSRHKKGRDMRPAQYFTETCGVDKAWFDEHKPCEDLSFSQSLQDLLRDDDLPPSLQGKIAVIHIDGNGFQAKRRAIGNDADALNVFSKAIKDKHTAIVTALLKYCFDNKETMIKAGTPPLLRFETLMWGGDELVFAVPAFAAWKLVEVIQEVIQKELKGFVLSIFDDTNFTTTSESNPKKLKKLKAKHDAHNVITYATGVVFAPVKTPIRSLKKIAEELVEEAKLTSKDHNAISLFACESVDLPVGGLSAARQKMFKFNNKTKAAFINYFEAQNWLNEVLKNIPKSQAMKSARDFIHQNDKWLNLIANDFHRLYGIKKGETLLNLLSIQSFIDEKDNKLKGKTDKIFKDKLELFSIFARDDKDITKEKDIYFHEALPLLTALHLWDYVDAQ